MHKFLKFTAALICLQLFFSVSGNCQLFGNKTNKNNKNTSTISAPLTFEMPRATLDFVYTDVIGITLDNIWSDIWWGSEYIPIIYLEDTNTATNGTDSTAVLRYADASASKADTDPQQAVEKSEFDVTKFTKETLKQIEDEKQALIDEEENASESDEKEEESEGFTELPEEYDIWSNTNINPYNVKCSEMKDTVKIDMSSYTPPIDYKYSTSGFGPRWGRIHTGIDLKVFKGDTIRSAFSGVVRIKKYDRYGYGNFVVVRHPNGLETLYGHMSETLVDEGQSVKAGDVIGLGGSTGRSTGNHLHFELRYLGNAFNPTDAINFAGHSVNDNTLVLTSSNFKYQKIRYTRSRRSHRGGSRVTIRRGDTLGHIAARNHTTVAKLKRLNGLRGNNIQAGKKLRVR